MTVIIIVTAVALCLALYEHFDTREWMQVTSPVRNNVVFEQRNKKYGAYSIRRDYNDMILILLICLFAMVGIFKIINSTFIDKTEIAVVPKYDTVEISLEAPPMEEIRTVETPYKVVGGGGGSGTPDDAPIDMKPKPMVNAGIMPTASTEKPGKGNKTTGDNRANPATSKVNNPFSSGSGGSGGGNKGGRGNGIGDDDGNGVGPGNGPGSSGGNGGAAERKWISKPNVAGIGDENCDVYLRLTVNAEGRIISAVNVSSKTTTTNTTIINQVISVVKADGRFNPMPGAKNVTFVNTFRVKPN
jgi:uncharacterized membrane protein YgcG